MAGFYFGFDVYDTFFVYFLYWIIRMSSMQKTPEDYHLDVLGDINIKSIRYKPSDSAIVLLCGGLADANMSSDRSYHSFRDALVHHYPVGPYEFFRPEEIQEWKEDGVFYDLLDYEKELGAICNLVVIVLESEGSFAELGAFSQMPDLKNKIHVINSEKNSLEKSFINLGILRHLEETTGLHPRVYPWDISTPSTINKDLMQDVVDDISEQLKELRSQHEFDCNNSSHFITLVVEIIRLFVALKETEIKNYIEVLGYSITQRELKRKLFILEKFEVIKKRRYSDSWFYMRTDSSFSSLSFARRSGKAHDAFRVIVACKEKYNNDKKHRNRMRVIRAMESE